MPAATARQAGRQGATDRSTRRNHIADRWSFIASPSVGARPDGSVHARGWTPQMVIPSGLGERRAACLLVVVRQTRRRGAACGAQTWGHRRHRRVWPASASHRSDRGKRTGGSSKSPPRRACPDVPSTRPRDDLPVPDVARWPSGQPRRMATPRDRRDGSGNLSSLLGYRGGVSWTGVDRANGARQIRRARRRNRRLVRRPSLEGREMPLADNEL